MQPAPAEVVQYSTVPVFDGDDRRALRGEQVVALVRSPGARLAEVVGVGDRADDREEQLWHAALRGGGARADESDCDEDGYQAPHHLSR